MITTETDSEAKGGPRCRSRLAQFLARQLRMRSIVRD